ncbi:nitric oxide synthase oxygenase [Natronolimnohabitans sp. A-GB9]|uniref:nitric oxide synthase oxygenase n=1 Tax=Natronolimnohabitans sp. A-GB9 TaxID=3069757 RepID=UPI0027B54179|nr:nitric oxide synthase oxygenase [Natronolimnohabitans sp. A-GB9]MDQ2049770.1 nitric oxide synthase oxygenase [Natronolimnohabitans sp. A-GB9]
MHAPVPEYDPERLLADAETFIRQCYTELDREDEIEGRIAEIESEIEETGHYEHTAAELEHGARMAWRNSNRCIGRLFWESLNVRDARDRSSAEGVYEELCEHLEYATNGGDIRPTITLFEPMVRGDQQVRIWNYQLIRYAGYETDDGVVGDPDSLEFTEYCQSKGWEGEGTDYDVLPLVIETTEEEPELFEVPEELVLEVPITHPDYAWFDELGLQWYAVPVVSNMRLEIGGLQYTAAPFNGWYMATEIAARNFGDEDRYDVLPEVADRLGLNTNRNRNLWKDEALVELNRAVLHSFERDGVKIVDHHTAAEQFEAFERREEAAGRDVTGDRSWLLPPMSSSTTHIFHKKYDNEINTPNFFYRPAPYEK